MGRDERKDDDTVSQVGEAVGRPSIAEITVSVVGEPPITVAVDSASPADNEPSTLEPRLSVRGLGPSSDPTRPSAPAAAKFAAPTEGRGQVRVPRRTRPNAGAVAAAAAADAAAAAADMTGADTDPAGGGSDDDDDDDEEPTALNVDERLAVAGVAAPSPDPPPLGYLITPSEPFTVTPPSTIERVPSTLETAPTMKMLDSSSLRVAAARPPGSGPQIRPSSAHRARMESELEDDAVTDKMRAVTGTQRNEPLPVRQTVPDVDEPSVVTASDVVGISPGLARALPRLDVPDALTGGQDEEGGAAGATVVMPLGQPAARPGYGPQAPGTVPLPAAGQPAPHVELGPHYPPPPATSYHAAPPFMAQPPPAAPAAPSAAPPPVVKRRGSGRVLFVLFLVSFVAAAGAVYLSRFRPAWMEIPGFLSDPVTSSAEAAPAPSVGVASEPSAARSEDASLAEASLPDAASAAAASAAGAAVATDAGAAADAGAADASARDASVAPAPSASSSSSARGRGRGRPFRR